MGWKPGTARRPTVAAELRYVLQVQAQLAVVLLLLHLLARLVGLPTSAWWMLVVAMAGALQVTSDRCWEEDRRRSTLAFALLVAPVVGVVPFLAVGAFLGWDTEATDAALPPSTVVGLLLASHALRIAHLSRLAHLSRRARRPGFGSAGAARRAGAGAAGVGAVGTPAEDEGVGSAAGARASAAEVPGARRTTPDGGGL
ncbi:hypothetical protein [Kitasatospora sp. NPDC050463]|uniref:hypothetical protein n=1 Tax=Kitasatospora sp. NPDC050463 TaxID=3155786 RepID=UPI0033F35DD8